MYAVRARARGVCAHKYMKEKCKERAYTHIYRRIVVVVVVVVVVLCMCVCVVGGIGFDDDDDIRYI